MYDNVVGTTHCEELDYLFCPHIIKDLGIPLPTPDSQDYKMINRLTQLWTDFAKTGYHGFIIFIRIPCRCSKCYILIINGEFDLGIQRLILLIRLLNGCR